MQTTLRPYWTHCRSILPSRPRPHVSRSERLDSPRRPCLRYFCPSRPARQLHEPSTSDLEQQLARLDQNCRDFGLAQTAFVDYAAAQRSYIQQSVTDNDLAATEARKAFGDTLPEGYLSPDQLKSYVRLYGEPVYRQHSSEEDALAFEEGGTGLMIENADGSLEELQFEEETASSEEHEPDTFQTILDSPAFIQLRKSKKGKFFALATKKELDDRILYSDMTISDEAALAYLDKEWRRLGDDEKTVYLDDVRYLKLEQYLRDSDKHIEADELLQCLYLFLESQAARTQRQSRPSGAETEAERYDQEEMPEENRSDDQAEDDDFLRLHPLTVENRFATFPSTVILPKSSFTGPVSAIISGSHSTHLAEAAQRLFGGPGLPYSTSNPHFARSMPQKPIPLDMTQERMSEIDADAYFAAIMPGTYASLMSALVETRKRLGGDWLQNLLNREGGPHILDAGAGGAGVVAFREMLRAEWERMHDDSNEPDAIKGVAPVDGREGGAPLEPPYGRATVLVGNAVMRRRASALLDDTSFVPRLPDYVHATDREAVQRGKFDVILAPHSLWSLKEDVLRKQYVANLWSLLRSDGGVLVLLEKGVPRGFEVIAGARKFLLDTRIASPGNTSASEEVTAPGKTNLQGVRDKDKGMIIAPCTNHSACPMYTRSGISIGRKDYCHFEQRYIRPPYLQKLVDAKSKNHEDVKFSYLSIMRGRDLREDTDGRIEQGEPATIRALKGYENMDALDADHFDPTAPAVGDLDLSSASSPHSLTLPRLILPPLKRTGHVILDVCTPSGTLERWTVTKSFSRQAFRDARKSAWGDLWALGAKTRVPKNVKLGRESGGHSIDLKKVRVSPKARKALMEQGDKKKRRTEVYDVPINPTTGRASDDEVRLVQGGRARHGKIPGIRDKRNKSGRVRVRKADRD